MSPRISRKDLKSTYFHVITQGIEKKFIFEKEIYKKKYLQLLYKESEEFKVKIIAYCVMDNHVHLLINVNEINTMSKFMHKLNFMYAQYYNFMEKERKGYVFRDRFISEPISSEDYLLNCIIYIHNNPVKAKMVKNVYEYKYSSYNKFVEDKEYNQIIDINKVVKNVELEDYIFVDIEHDINEILKKVIKKYEKKYNLNFEKIQERNNREILFKLVKELKENYKISYKEIARQTRISLSTISRLMKKNDLFLPRPQTSQKEIRNEI